MLYLYTCTYVRTNKKNGTYHWYVRTYAAVKVAKYADQDNFIPFILETGGTNKAARDWLDALTAPEPGEQVPSQDDHPWNPRAQVRSTRVPIGCVGACCSSSQMAALLYPFNTHVVPSAPVCSFSIRKCDMTS